MKTLRRRQTIVPLGRGTLRLPVSENTAQAVLSPYFQRQALQKIGTGRVKILILIKIMKKALVRGGIVVNYGDSKLTFAMEFFDENGQAGSSIEKELHFSAMESMTDKDVRAEVIDAILTEASIRSYTGFTAQDIFWDVPSYVGAIQPYIEDCPADAVTDYNVVTTLLGTLTSAVNTANAKQNDIATKFNSLKSELVEAGILAAS